jgi:hypothetical protein
LTDGRLNTQGAGESAIKGARQGRTQGLAAGCAAGRPERAIRLQKRRLTSQIKERTLTLHFLPGQYVNEGALCAMRSAGRRPVHQALERLEIEDASRSCRTRV